MSSIDLPHAPGYFISRWREQGPVDVETLTSWKNEMNWETWLPLAEAALYLDAAELLAIIETLLSPAAQATLSLVRRRMLGDTRLHNAIEEAPNEKPVRTVITLLTASTDSKPHI